MNLKGFYDNLEWVREDATLSDIIIVLLVISLFSIAFIPIFLITLSFLLCVVIYVVFESLFKTVKNRRYK